MEEDSGDHHCIHSDLKSCWFPHSFQACEQQWSNTVKFQLNMQMEIWAEEISYLPDSATPSQTSLNKANPFHTRPLLSTNNRGPWKKYNSTCPLLLWLTASLNVLLSYMNRKATGSVILFMSALGVIEALAIYWYLKKQRLVTHSPRKSTEKWQLIAQMMYSIVFPECTTRHRSRLEFLWYDMKVIMAWRKFIRSFTVFPFIAKLCQKYYWATNIRPIGSRDMQLL